MRISCPLAQAFGDFLWSPQADNGNLVGIQIIGNAALGVFYVHWIEFGEQFTGGFGNAASLPAANCAKIS